MTKRASAIRIPSTALLHRAAGSPKFAAGAAGTCRACGIESAGVPFDAWVKPTFTDWDKIAPGEILCQACQFCFCDQSGLLATLVGKSKPQRMRNYSHFVAGDRWIPLSKGDKPRMRALLLDPGLQLAVIADSGQRHILFRAKPGWWQFEEHALRPAPEALPQFLLPVEELYAGGIFSKREIASGAYSQRRVLEFGPERWARVEPLVRPMRGQILFTLAVFLAQPKEEGEERQDDAG